MASVYRCESDQSVISNGVLNAMPSDRVSNSMKCGVYTIQRTVDVRGTIMPFNSMNNTNILFCVNVCLHSVCVCVCVRCVMSFVVRGRVRAFFWGWTAIRDRSYDVDARLLAVVPFSKGPSVDLSWTCVSARAFL